MITTRTWSSLRYRKSAELNSRTSRTFGNEDLSRDLTPQRVWSYLAKACLFPYVVPRWYRNPFEAVDASSTSHAYWMLRNAPALSQSDSIWIKTALGFYIPFINTEATYVFTQRQVQYNWHAPLAHFDKWGHCSTVSTSEWETTILAEESAEVRDGVHGQGNEYDDRCSQTRFGWWEVHTQQCVTIKFSLSLWVSSPAEVRYLLDLVLIVVGRVIACILNRSAWLPRS